MIGGLVSATMIVGTIPATSALAGTITVANQAPAADTNAAAETYACYKVFDAVKAAEGGGIAYKIAADSPWFPVLFAADGTPVSGNVWFTATAIPGEAGIYEVRAANGFTGDAKDCADWLLAHKGEIAGTPLAVGTNQVDDGYYLVQSSLGANLGLATTDLGMDVVDKNTYPSIDKRQNDDGTTAEYSDDAVSVAVGDTIFYDVVVYVPASADKDITVVDAMSEGIAYDSATGVTAGGVADAAAGPFAGTLSEADYAVSAEVERGFTVTIHPTDAVRGKYLELKFQGTVTADAITGDASQRNTATLAYSNYAQSDAVTYSTSATGVQKYDGATADFVAADNTLAVKEGVDSIRFLAGAEFELQTTDGTAVPVVKVTDAANGDYYRPAVAGETGESLVTAGDYARIDIRGLDGDKGYQLVETKAPDGYNLLTTPAGLVLMANNADAAGHAVNAVAEASVKKIANAAGSLFPTTGGMGTTILYVVGGTLVAGAVAFLVVKARTRKPEAAE